ncbi:hypothetical protein Droror1_Dr00028049 [Drosera rotundifolia]
MAETGRDENIRPGDGDVADDVPPAKGKRKRPKKRVVGSQGATSLVESDKDSKAMVALIAIGVSKEKWVSNEMDTLKENVGLKNKGDSGVKADGLEMRGKEMGVSKEKGILTEKDVP